MLQQQYKTDEYGKEILLQDNKHQVMMEWEKPYMEACIDKLQPKGDVLEIGFGMGYSATQIQKYKPKSHTIIEMDPTVIKRLKKWAKDHDNIVIVEGTWQKEIHNLGKFDEIFFDDFPLKEPKNLLEKKLLGERFPMFLDICRYNHSKATTKISAYIHDPDGTFKQRMDENPYYSYKEYFMDIDLPTNCNYYRDDKGIIPIISKVSRV
jgi:guanidinoacetate N-methyltransferase